ncbi:hypothetical protein O7634_25205 [Micromonospora sp. WMMD1120]|uniref:hypothetical protein n=1 Tax=Micromonospora sp. WMMD1120 TaxID=3016106 RepID=UPI00241738E3|nr:hypothetical protein [Micromonospora sp. WMMD1120]MDG4810064.1 hypothetical protein [Micromonospora sp. WMMD1120]
MGLALSTLGLVHRWGQQVPRWVPLIGARRIPARPVVLAALVGGALLVAICAYLIPNSQFHFVERGWVGIGGDEPTRERPGTDVLRYYVPMVLWGPLVIAVAVDYARRVAVVRSPRPHNIYVSQLLKLRDALVRPTCTVTRIPLSVAVREGTCVCPREH